jgi:hypothetical protein
MVFQTYEEAPKMCHEARVYHLIESDVCILRKWLFKKGLEPTSRRLHPLSAVWNAVFLEAHILTRNAMSAFIKTLPEWSVLQETATKNNVSWGKNTRLIFSQGYFTGDMVAVSQHIISTVWSGHNLKQSH